MKNVFFGGFNDMSSIVQNFSHYYWKGVSEDNERKAIETSLDGAEILFAAYGGRSYEGAAFVLYRKDGKLFEVNGGHCSCNGLEGQWGPEETTVAALKMRQSSNDYRGGIINEEEYEKEAVNRFNELLKELEENG